MYVSTIKDDILKTILYYNIFKHPLTLEEIFAFCASPSDNRENIKRELDTLVNGDDKLLGTLNGYYFVVPNNQYVEERLRKEDFSRKQWKTAKIMTMIIKVFPFVRGVFVTGTLSKNSSDENSDIDFLIICKDNRLWISRTLLRLFIKLFRLQRNNYLCANYFLSESNLSINDRNVFTATELAHIKVMYNTALLDKLIQQNTWIEDFFPNYANSERDWHHTPFMTRDKKSTVQSFFELFFPKKIGDWLDDLLLWAFISRKRAKSPRPEYQENDTSVTIAKNAAKVHGSEIDHRKKTLSTYKNIFCHYNLPC
jgi:Zn-finger nucleic acid-binding protein